MAGNDPRSPLGPDLRAGAGLHEITLFLETRRMELEDTLDELRARFDPRADLLRLLATLRRDYRTNPRALLTAAGVIGTAAVGATVYTLWKRGRGDD